MSKNNYWQDRFIEEEERLNKIAGDEFRRQQLEYERAIARMNKDIEVWYNRIAKNNDVSLVEAKKMLNDKELKEFKWTLDEYIKHGEENGIKKDWSRQLENASARVHIERLEAMKLQVRGEIEKLYNGRESSMENFLKDTYKDSYYHTAFEIAKGTGIGTNLYKLNDKLVGSVIKKPWAPDGINFSERIWNDKNKLINTLHTELTQGFIRGDSLDKLTNKIAEKMNVSKVNASRLVYTEHAAYASKAREQTLKDLDVEKYEIVATLDSRTSKICQGLDRKVFDMKDHEVGTTAPPFHVHCRTTTAPWFEDDGIGERAARNEETGKTEYVPANTSYKDWEKSFVKDPVEKIETKGYNINYKTVPKTLQNYKNHLKSWYEDNVNGIVSEEDEVIVSQKLKEIIDKSEYSMRFKSNNLEELINSGRFKNQFETSTSGGTVSEKFRKTAPKNLFGVQSKLKAEDYEKYGYLSSQDVLKEFETGKNVTLQQYGDLIIKFNKDLLKDRVTFTIDDSLGNAILKTVVADNVNKPSLNGMNLRKIKNYTEIIKNTNSLSIEDLALDLNVRYFELQFHGELNLNTVKSIYFTEQLPESELLNNLKKLGIRTYKIEGDKIVEI